MVAQGGAGQRWGRSSPGRPRARRSSELSGATVALERGAGLALDGWRLEPPAVICVGAEREGLPPEVSENATVRAEIPLRPDGPDSLNVAMAATIALYELGTRMAADG